MTDLRLTLTARNYAPDDTAFIATLRDFYESRNIVFLYNLQSGDQFVGLMASLRLLSAHVSDLDAVPECGRGRHGNRRPARGFTALRAE